MRMHRIFKCRAWRTLVRMLKTKTHGPLSFFPVRCVQDGSRQEQAVDEGQEGSQEEDVSGYHSVMNNLVMLRTHTR